ncbi:TIGR03619 family F420-dependent LLM class oxidoreductase [Phycicoccus flavus]|uniref:TIGR03619 family F420-dependent LLM class oxidoreductase n=1 Tax=Phycicoccus flavus TaxID=2502783 RepID=UPI001F298F5B|nr:TIGR03619 family F420-dependent LLM class oxidoreductase [Phycicoccus flavus]
MSGGGVDGGVALGVGLPVSGPWATPAGVRHVARRAEELGYASLWTFQRLLSPVGRDLGPGHASVLDPVLALTLAAADTTRVGLGTATVCAPFVPPMVLAKAMATLDVLSEGRLTVGVGMGWLPEEYAAAGVPFARRGARFEEYLRCLVALWTQDPVEFYGDFYTVPPAHVAPSPVQRPHPPVLVGGTAPAALYRAGRLAQGWIGSSGHDLARIARDVQVVRDGARDAGRDVDAVRVLVRAVPDLRDTPAGPDRRPFQGTAEQVRADVAALGEQGVTEVFLDLNLAPALHAPGVAPEEALALADRVLEACAPPAG